MMGPTLGPVVFGPVTLPALDKYSPEYQAHLTAIHYWRRV